MCFCHYLLPLSPLYFCLLFNFLPRLSVFTSLDLSENVYLPCTSFLWLAAFFPIKTIKCWNVISLNWAKHNLLSEIILNDKLNPQLSPLSEHVVELFLKPRLGLSALLEEVLKGILKDARADFFVVDFTKTAHVSELMTLIWPQLSSGYFLWLFSVHRGFIISFIIS